MAKTPAQLVAEEQMKKEKEIMAKAARRVKETVYFETSVGGPKVKLRFTGSGPSPALNKEFRGNDGPPPKGDIVVPRGGMILVSKGKADQLEEDYPDEFDVLQKAGK